MKKSHPILYLPPAENDLIEILDYVRRESPTRAFKLLGQFDRAVSRLGRFPLSGAISRDPLLKQKGYRILVIGNYLVFYRFEGGLVSIYRVIHGKRRYEFLL
jgi:toxin ParE1/3/4